MPRRYNLKAGAVAVDTGGASENWFGLPDVERRRYIDEMMKRAGADLSDYLGLRPDRADFYFNANAACGQGKNTDTDTNTDIE